MKGSFDVEQPRQAHLYAPSTNLNNPPPRTVPVIILGAENPELEPLPCGGLGYGWTLFILGFFLLIPWYVGAFLPWCLKKDEPREKLGCSVCLIACNVVNLVLIIWVIKSMA